VQIVCIWSSCCHCIPKPRHSLASFNSRKVLPFWCRLTQVVLEKRPLNGLVVLVVVVVVVAAAAAALVVLFFIGDIRDPHADHTTPFIPVGRIDAVLALWPKN